ncbi:hypothetical protein D3C87_1963160 [compost metagenome]
MALQFDIEPVAKQIGQSVEPANGIGILAMGEGHVDAAFRAAGKADEPRKALPRHPVETGPRKAILAFEIGAGNKA